MLRFTRLTLKNVIHDHENSYMVFDIGYWHNIRLCNVQPIYWNMHLNFVNLIQLKSKSEIQNMNITILIAFLNY